MSLASLRDAIISQFALVNHTQTSRKFIPPAVTPPALSQDWQSPADPNAYHPQRAMAECIANAVEPEITNRVDLNVKQRFDPTAALPASPTVGDVYLATATANGWTAGDLYTWNGTTYDETIPGIGLEIWITNINTASIYSGTEWIDLALSTQAGVISVDGRTGAVTLSDVYDPLGAAATVQGNLTTHISLTGTSVHGLGTAATHAASDFQAAGSYQSASSILSALAGLNWSTGTPFVKMTGAAAFSLDTATYQPLASNLTAISSITPVRGGLIVANATPEYAALALGGASGSILTRNATDPSWSAYYLAGTAGQTYTFPTASCSVVGGSGTQYYVPLWGSGGATLGNSLLSQVTVGSYTGIQISQTAGAGVDPTITNPNNVANMAQFNFYPASGTNTCMALQIVPRGTGLSGNVAESTLFNTDFTADSSNYEFMVTRAAGTYFLLSSGKVGSGTLRPISFSCGYAQDLSTNINQLVLQTNGYVNVMGGSPVAPFQVGTLLAGETVGNTPVAHIIGASQSLSSQTMVRLWRPFSAGAWYGSAVDFNVYAYGAAAAPWNPKTQFDICLKNTASSTQTANIAVLTLKDDGTITIPALSTAGAGVLHNSAAGLISTSLIVAADVTTNTLTYATMQQVSATSRVLGRITAGAGNIEELTAANLKTICGYYTSGDNPSFAGLTISGFTVAGGVLQNAVTTGALSSHACGNTYLQMGNSSGQLADTTIYQTLGDPTIIFGYDAGNSFTFQAAASNATKYSAFTATNNGPGLIQMVSYGTTFAGTSCGISNNNLSRVNASATAMLIDVNGTYPLYLGANGLVYVKVDPASSEVIIEDGTNVLAYFQGGQVGNNYLQTGNETKNCDLRVNGDVFLSNFGTAGTIFKTANIGFDGKLVACTNLQDVAYQPLLTNPVTGSGTQHYLPVWGAGGTTLGNSPIWTDGTNVGIGTTAPGQALTIVGWQSTNPGHTVCISSNLSNGAAGIQVNITNNVGNWGLMLGYDDVNATVSLGSYHNSLAAYVINVENGPLNFGTNNTLSMTILSSGLVGIGNTAPGNTLTLGTAGNHSASFGIADRDNPTVSTGNYTPVCSRVEFHSAAPATMTLLAGSLPEGTILICTQDNSSSYVTVNNHAMQGGIGCMFVKTHDGGWTCIGYGSVT